MFAFLSKYYYKGYRGGHALGEIWGKESGASISSLNV
jgi:hypothetical protein